MPVSAKVDNSALPLKVGVRRWILERTEEPAVLDLYCGKVGKMYQLVWREAGTYLGTDKNEPHGLGPAIKLSAERAVSTLPLDRWNIYDIDPYDSPWAIARKIIHRRGPGLFGLVLTSGEGRGLRNGDSNEIIRRTIGASSLSNLTLLGRWQYDVMGLMIRSLLEMEGMAFSGGVQAHTGGPNPMYYFGLLLHKTCQTGKDML